jgi:hypothetical protein
MLRAASPLSARPSAAALGAWGSGELADSSRSLERRESRDNALMGHARIAAEDKFALVTPGLEGAARPSFGEARNLARAVGELARAVGDSISRWDTMWDVRSLKGDGDRRYPDACATLSALLDELHTSPRPQPILVRPGQADVLAFYMGWWETVPKRSPIIEVQPKPLPKRALDLRLFAEEELDPYEVFDALPTSVQDYLDAAISLGLTTADEHHESQTRKPAEQQALSLRALANTPPIPMEMFEPLGDIWAEAIELKRSEVISQVLESVATNSLLVQVALNSDESGQIHVVPYHSYSLHGVVTLHDEVVLMRPGRTSDRYWSRFRSEILALERLLNDPRATERQIEQLLVDNPLFLRGLNDARLWHF